MLKQELIYSEERGTWNLFVNDEWYFEGTYEQCSDMMCNNAADEYEEIQIPDDYYGDVDDEEEYDEMALAHNVAFAETMDGYGMI